MTTPDLKPCPFCGGINFPTAIAGADPGDHVACDHCGAVGPDDPSAHWSTRPIEDALRAKVAALAAAVDAMSAVMWMAERYAEGGGSRGPEMQDYDAAMTALRAARGQK